MTCKYVPIWNVTPCGGPTTSNLSIQDVLGDFTTLTEYKNTRNIDLADVFVSPNIIPSYIDPDWCAGDNDAERFQELSTDDPISCYDYIEYGGCTDESVPEIYFSNLKGWNTGDVELLEGGEIEYIDSFPVLGIAAYYSVLNPYYKDQIVRYPGDAEARYLPAFYREGAPEFLQRYGASSKVKVDYDGELPANVNFKLKVTTVLGSDYIARNQFYYKAGDSFENDSPHQIPFPLWAAIPPTAAGIAEAASGGQLFDYLLGPLTDKLYELGTKLSTNVALEGFSILTLMLIAEYVLLRTSVELADVIYDLVAEFNQTDIETGYKVWDIITGGKYNNYDIRESSILINHNAFKGSTNNIEVIAKDGEYLSSVYNYNTLDLTKWFNFETRPKGAPFDKMTPPPNTMYIVEIIPISNCVVSSDPKKPHIIAFTCSPDKYVQPNFDVLPSEYVCASTLVKLQDALYADFLYLKDLERDDLFDPYRNIVINTGNYKNNETTVNLEYTGEDIIAPIDVVSSNYAGTYEVLFMKEIGELNQQFIFNSNCLYRGHGVDAYNVIKKYWTLPSNWSFSGGAIYKNTNSDTQVTQYCPYMTGKINWDVLYKFEIEVVNSSSGKAYLELDNTFAHRICADKYDGGGDKPKKVKIIELSSSEYPTGVTLVGTRVYFEGNKHHVVYLEARGRNAIDKIIKIGGDVNFDGGISKVLCRRISPYSPTVEERAVPMYSEIIDITSCPNANTLYLLVSSNINSSFNIQFGNFQHEPGGSDITAVDVDWGDGNSESTNLSGDVIESLTHSYTTQQFGLPYLVSIKINGYIKQADAAILPYFKCNNAYLIDYADYYGVTWKGTVDLADTGLRSASIIDVYTGIDNASVILNGTASDGSHTTYDFFTGTYTYIPMLSRFLGVKKLVLTNVDIYNDLFNLGGVSDYIDINNTPISGDLSELSLVSNTIKCNNTKVNSYSTVTKMHCKNIWWQDSDPIMGVNDLNDLCRDLYNSSITGGQLFIASNNPKITDEQILWYIFQLVHEYDWIVVYNGYYITTANEANYLQSGTDDYIYTDN